MVCTCPGTWVGARQPADFVSRRVAMETMDQADSFPGSFRKALARTPPCSWRIPPRTLEGRGVDAGLFKIRQTSHGLPNLISAVGEGRGGAKYLTLRPSDIGGLDGQ